VLLDKLPFAPVNNPILIKMTEYVESRGLDPFTEISLPEAFVKLSQIVGRLIRSESDTGKITIADNRTRTKAYAKRMIKSLPPFTIKQ
jgi:ATP-dependent DNA helicase DinG